MSLPRELYPIIASFINDSVTFLQFMCSCRYFRDISYVIRDDKMTEFTKDGRLPNGNLHGLITDQWDIYRDCRETMYYNGKKEGYEYISERDKTAYAGFYENDMEEGIWESWDLKTGKMRYSGLYKNGNREGLWTFWSNSGSVVMCNYKNGNLHGWDMGFNEFGRLQSIAWMKNNEFHGPFKRWYKNGQLFEESHYKCDRKVEYKKWDIYGTLVSEWYD